MILDAEHRERGILHHRTIAEVDAFIARSFCEGLLLQYWLQMTPEHRENHLRPSLAKREELDKTETHLNDQTLRIRPLADSTPRRDMFPSRY